MLMSAEGEKEGGKEERNNTESIMGRERAVMVPLRSGTRLLFQASGYRTQGWAVKDLELFKFKGDSKAGGMIRYGFIFNSMMYALC